MSLRIFVLEDEIDQLPRSAILPALSGHTVTVARNFPDAKEKYQGEYDLLLLDCDMRGIWGDHNHHNSGLRFCEWLVKQRTPTKPKVVLHSQNYIGRGMMRELLLDCGFTDVVEQAFDHNFVFFLERLVLQF